MAFSFRLFLLVVQNKLAAKIWGIMTAKFNVGNYEAKKVRMDIKYNLSFLFSTKLSTFIPHIKAPCNKRPIDVIFGHIYVISGKNN